MAKTPSLSELVIAFIGVVLFEEAVLCGALYYQSRLMHKLSHNVAYWALLPPYRIILHFLILQLLFDGGLALWFIDAGKKSAPPQFLLFISQLLDHLGCEGITLLVLHHGIGRTAFMRSLVGAFLFALLPASVWALNLTWPFKAFDENTPWSELNIVLAGLLTAFYFALWATPLRLWYRRAAARTLGFIFGLINAVELATCLCSDRTDSLTTTEVALFGAYLLSQFLAPAFVFYALIQDSRFWSGQTEWRKKSPALRIPLISPLPYHSVERLSSLMDDLGDVVLNFCFLKIQRDVVLGQGSTSRVYAGTYRGEAVAVKVLFRLELTPEVISGFCDEAHFLTRLTHPNVIRMLGICVLPPSLCIVLEHCEHGSLQSYVQLRIDTLQPRDRLLLCMDCCAAVAFLHSQETPIIHGDIKSPNFLVAHDARSNRDNVKLIDLESSVSFSFETRKDAPDCPYWLAPELIQRRSPSRASDVYALAVVVWEVMTGLTPFADIGENRAEIATLITQGLRPRITSAVPPSVATLMFEIWTNVPSERPVAKQLLDAVRDQLSSM